MLELNLISSVWYFVLYIIAYKSLITPQRTVVMIKEYHVCKFALHTVKWYTTYEKEDLPCYVLCFYLRFQRFNHDGKKISHVELFEKFFYNQSENREWFLGSPMEQQQQQNQTPLEVASTNMNTVTHNNQLSCNIFGLKLTFHRW